MTSAKSPAPSPATKPDPDRTPSLYPGASPYMPPPPPSPAPSADPTSPTRTSSSFGALPPAYELLLELPVTLTEGPPTALSPSAIPVQPVLDGSLNGNLRVIQGPRQDSEPPNASYHAFLSLNSVNVPLLPTHPARRLSETPPIFEVRIPHRIFALRVDKHVEPELVDALQSILQWFCGWVPGDDAVNVSSAHGAVPTPPQSSAAPTEGVVTPPSTPTESQDRFARAGDRGVEFVEFVGTKINNTIQKRLSARVEKAKETEPRNAKLGGGVTNKVLTGARVVVGKGAEIASAATEKIAGVVGKGLAKNPITKSFSEAREGSSRRKFHDNLMAGMLAFGRIYVAADNQGKVIIGDTGTGAAEYAGVTYGDEAEQVARQLGVIALDGYRIARFPNKLGATAILKGALKSTARNQENMGHAIHASANVEGSPPAAEAKT